MDVEAANLAHGIPRAPDRLPLIRAYAHLVLSPREQTLLTLRYTDGLTTRAAAPLLGVQKTQLHRLELAALRKLQDLHELASAVGLEAALEIRRS